MKTYKNLYQEIYSINNLLLAWRKARKGKTKKTYVIEFEKDVIGNLFQLQKELIEETYQPKPLVIFILRDPKTRKISKSAFRESNKKRNLSYADCLGYVIAEELGIKFLTGDKEFKDLENVEFVEK